MALKYHHRGSNSQKFKNTSKANSREFPFYVLGWIRVIRRAEAIKPRPRSPLRGRYPPLGPTAPPAFASEKQRRFHPAYQSFGRRCTGSSAYGGVYEP